MTIEETNPDQSLSETKYQKSSSNTNCFSQMDWLSAGVYYPFYQLCN